MNTAEIQEAGPPRRFKIIFLFLIGMALLIGLSTATFILAARGQATLSNQEKANKVSACRLIVAGQYEDKRDAIITAASAAEIEVARTAFRAFVLGPHGQEENRAERSMRLCGK